MKHRDRTRNSRLFVQSLDQQFFSFLLFSCFFFSFNNSSRTFCSKDMKLLAAVIFTFPKKCEITTLAGYMSCRAIDIESALTTFRHCIDALNNNKAYLYSPSMRATIQKLSIIIFLFMPLFLYNYITI